MYTTCWPPSWIRLTGTWSYSMPLRAKADAQRANLVNIVNAFNEQAGSPMLVHDSPMRTLQEQELLKYPWRTGYKENKQRTKLSPGAKTYRASNVSCQLVTLVWDAIAFWLEFFVLFYSTHVDRINYCRPFCYSFSPAANGMRSEDPSYLLFGPWLSNICPSYGSH